MVASPCKRENSEPGALSGAEPRRPSLPHSRNVMLSAFRVALRFDVESSARPEPILKPEPERARTGVEQAHRDWHHLRHAVRRAES